MPGARIERVPKGGFRGSMSLHDAYRLLEPIPDPVPVPEAALLARESASGLPVVVHLLPKNVPGLTDPVLAKLRNLPLPHARQILDIGEHGENSYVVSHVLPGNLPLARWLESIGFPVEPAAVKQAEPGEFTRLFAEPLGGHPAPSAPQPGSGEFTRTIGQPVEAVAPAPTAARVPEHASTHAEPPAATPGEFTRMFAQPVEPVASGITLADARGSEGSVPRRDRKEALAKPEPTIQPERHAAPPAAPGEFTRMFAQPVETVASGITLADARGSEASVLSRDREEALAKPEPTTQPERHPEPPAAAPGEFTRMFAQPVEPVASGTTLADARGSEESVPSRDREEALAKPEPTTAPGEFTRMFAQPVEPVPPAPTATKVPEPVPSPPPAQFKRVPVQPIAAEPSKGEFTRIFVQPLEDAAHEVSTKTAPVGPKPPSGDPPPSVGEFTRLFQVPVQAKSAPAPYSPPPPLEPIASPPEHASRNRNEAGEFTRLMQGPRFGDPGPPAAPEPHAYGTPGEFTRMLDSPVGSPPPATNYRPHIPQNQPPQAPMTGFDRMVSADPFAPASSNAGDPGDGGATRLFSPGASARPAAPAVRDGPSEFTRMVAAPAAAAPKRAKPAPPKPVKPALPGAGPKPLTIIVVLAVLLLIAVGVVVFFALQP
jgi:hypothetical protein